MNPDDMTSAVGTLSLQVLVDNNAKEVGDAMLGPIAADVRLMTWPEGTSVEVTSQIQAFKPRRENGVDVFGSGKVVVVPSAPLDDRWYFLHLATAPDAVDVAGPTRLHKLSDGRVGTRFTPASDPRMTWVRRCVEPEATGKVVVEFSEIVDLGSAEALTIGASGACSGPAVGSDGLLRGDSFTFTCDGLTSSPLPQVVAASTVTSVSGRPLFGGGVTRDFPVTAFTATTDCPAAAVDQQ